MLYSEKIQHITNDFSLVALFTSVFISIWLTKYKEKKVKKELKMEKAKDDHSKET